MSDGSGFQEVAERNARQMVIFTDDGFVKKDWHPENLKICKRGEWNTRTIVETVLSMLTLVCHFKNVLRYTWNYFKTRLAFTIAMFNILVQWHGIQLDDRGCVHFSIAEFSL